MDIGGWQALRLIRRQFTAAARLGIDAPRRRNGGSCAARISACRPDQPRGRPASADRARAACWPGSLAFGHFSFQSFNAASSSGASGTLRRVRPRTWRGRWRSNWRHDRRCRRCGSASTAWRILLVARRLLLPLSERCLVAANGPALLRLLSRKPCRKRQPLSSIPPRFWQVAVPWMKLRSHGECWWAPNAVRTLTI